MSERAKNVVAIVLAAVALAALVAMGGDGRDLEDHARWMALTKDRGTEVMW